MSLATIGRVAKGWNSACISPVWDGVFAPDKAQLLSCWPCRYSNNESKLILGIKLALINISSLCLNSLLNPSVTDPRGTASNLDMRHPSDHNLASSFHSMSDVALSFLCWYSEALLTRVVFTLVKTHWILRGHDLSVVVSVVQVESDMLVVSNATLMTFLRTSMLFQGFQAMLWIKDAWFRKCNFVSPVFEWPVSFHHDFLV